MVSKVPASLHYLFWDTRPETLSVQENAPYIIDRILNKGDLQALQWLNKTYSSADIVERVTKSRQLSKKDVNFFSMLYAH